MGSTSGSVGRSSPVVGGSLAAEGSLVAEDSLAVEGIPAEGSLGHLRSIRLRRPDLGAAESLRSRPEGGRMEEGWSVHMLAITDS